ncbi:MAG TPA: DCC1-like thiol-disulfide oxidoreductase family protein [Solimonas sp.]|nr:DCC1-like thiol-disulfide oxidoreductase family protein [Solimonas sp.]
MTSDLALRHPRLAGLLGVDLRTLALFRCALGLTLCVSLLWGICDLSAFWTDWGVMPRSWIIENDSANRISLYFLNGSSWFTGTLLTLQCVFALMYAFGWRTRLANILSFVLWGSLMNRNPITLIGGDLLASCLLFWSMFLPVGARFSVDAALATNLPPADNRHVSWASAGLLIQVASVYAFSAVLKNGAEWFPDYTAVYYTMSLDRYATPLGQWLLNFPVLLKGLTFFVFWLEALGPWLLFSPVFNRPLRFAVMLMFMAMHTGFIFCLEIGHFPYISLCSLTVFLGGWAWDWLDARHQQRNPGTLRIYYDRDCGFCLKSCLLFRQFLVLPRVQIAPAQDTPRAKALLEANYSWVVIDIDDQAYLKWPAFVVLLRRSPLWHWLWLLLRSPRLERPGNVVYDFVGRHRGGFGTLTGVLLPMREVRWDVARFWQRIAGVFVVLVFVWNVATLENAGRRYLGYHPLLDQAARKTFQWLGPPFRALRIDQLWNMFAPFPLKDDGWMVIPGRLADGTEIDVLHPDRAPSYDKPHHYSQTHENIRWHTYRGRMWESEFSKHRLYFGKYLCRSFNEGKLTDPELRKKRLMTFKIVYMIERTLPGYEPSKVERNVIWRHECFPAETKGDIP